MFDKNVVEVVMERGPLCPRGTEVNLSDGRKGLIYENKGPHNLRPILNMPDGTKLDLMENKNLNVTILPPEYLDTVSPDSEEPERKKMVQEAARKKIMIVDDMGANLDAMRGILEDEYTVILCKCGKQALHYLEHNEFPDLIIMDVDMPEMNGIETTMRANKLTGGRIPVLFVTAMCDAHTVMTCRRLHAAGYIVRPYKAIYIKSEVERIFSGWR